MSYIKMGVGKNNKEDKVKINNRYNLSLYNSDGLKKVRENFEKRFSDEKIKSYDFLEFISENEYDDLKQYDKMSKINYKDLPDGVSRYEYKGARYSIYKRGDRYKSEFYYPRGYNKDNFFNNFDKLKPKENDIEENTSTKLVDSINGELDEKIMQGDSGDCWLLVALNSLNSTEKGKQIIKDSITLNDDNTATVTFRGIGISYTISANEVARYDTDNNSRDSYSNGDNDALVIEIATQKLWEDINSGRVKLDTTSETITDISRSIEDGGFPSQMFYYLTGIEAKEYANESNNQMNNIDTEEIYKILNEAYENKNTTMTIGIYNGEHKATLTDGSEYSLDVGSGGHALSVTNITEDTVTFVNPWDNSVEYTMSYSEFANLGIGYISVCDLNKTQYKEGITDMTRDTSDSYSNYSYSDYDFDYDFNPSYYDEVPESYEFDYTRSIDSLINSMFNFFKRIVDMFESYFGGYSNETVQHKKY